MGDIPLYPENASIGAGQFDIMFFATLFVAVFFTTLVAGAVLYFSFRYRRRSEDEVPKQISGNTKLEVGIMVPLAGLAIIFFAWNAVLYMNLWDPPEDALQIYVAGKQWMWKMEHPDGQQEINTLHVPVDTPVELLMTSQDVIHSFYVPAFRVKHDVLPGRYTTLWFNATKTGEYHLFCAEYCGTNHSRMVGTIYVMEPTEYEDWLASAGTVSAAGDTTTGSAVSPEVAGAQLYDSLGCASCHNNGIGPSLVNIFGQERELEGGGTAMVDENYLRNSILDPTAQVVAGYQPIMPTFQGQVDEDQLHQLIKYIESLSDSASDSEQ